MKTQTTSQIVIIDLGSQYTQVIRRSLRYLGFHSEIVTPEKSWDWIMNNEIKGIIISGGDASVYDEDAPRIPKEIIHLNIPILGICYGMQWLSFVHDNYSVHTEKDEKSYGPVIIDFNTKIRCSLFTGLGSTLEAWASHGDSVRVAPAGFIVAATSNNGQIIESIFNPHLRFYGVQFHPEVNETKDENMILHNFVKKICECNLDYFTSDVIKKIQDNTKKILGDGRAIIGVSGGVDSTTLAAILAPVLGDKLKAFIIDTGGMRKGEIKQIREIAVSAGIDLQVYDFSDKFTENISKTIDAEEKRTEFRKVYKLAFEQVAREFNATHIIQGTLATDLIESGAAGKSALIKTHHNVGLNFGLEEISPFSDFFKFEVRRLAKEIGLGDLISKRQPFPGPGLFIRIVGIPVSIEFLKIVREADNTVKDILIKHDLYDQISQTVVGLWGLLTVGVKGDSRVYGYPIVVRTVSTTDFMTTIPFHLSSVVQDEIVNELVKHKQIVRVVFDPTPKPPATTEFE